MASGLERGLPPTEVGAQVLRHQLRTEVRSMVCFWLRHQLRVKNP